MHIESPPDLMMAIVFGFLALALCLCIKRRHFNQRAQLKAAAPEPVQVSCAIPPPLPVRPKQNPVHADVLHALIDKFQALQTEIGQLRQEVQSGHDTLHLLLHYGETMDRLSARVRELEDDATFEHVLKPVLLDVILLHDALRKAANQQADNELLQGLAEDALATLARHDVTPMLDTDENFVPSKQRVVGVRTDGNAQPGIVAAVSRTGFYHQGKVLRAEEVIIQRKERAA